MSTSLYHILAYLRSRAIFSCPSERPSLPQVEAGKQKAYMDLVKYLVLDDFMGYSSNADMNPQKFSFASSAVQIDQQQQRAVVTERNRDHLCSIIVEPLVQSHCCLKLRVRHDKKWMFVGIATDIPLNNGRNYNLPTTHGWGSHGLEVVYGATTDKKHSVSLSTGDTVVMMADFERKLLCLKSSGSATPAYLPLKVPAEQQHEFAFYIMLYSAGDEVELFSVSAEDLQSFYPALCSRCAAFGKQQMRSTPQG